MRYFFFVIITLTVWSCILFSCEKYHDPAPQTIIYPHGQVYCNDPTAVNYNWGFPGNIDNTICFFPTDVFKGNYLYRDSVYRDDTLFIRADSFYLTFAPISHQKMTVSGFCSNGNKLTLTAGLTYVATIDTLEGDSLTINYGQVMCRSQDTVAGSITRDLIDSALVHISFVVASDTGVTTHYGSARKY
jgi:hypothetical protein